MMKRNVIINKQFGDYTVGQIVAIEVDVGKDKDGKETRCIPLDKRMRRAFYDAKTDGCVSYETKEQAAPIKTEKGSK